MGNLPASRTPAEPFALDTVPACLGTAQVLWGIAWIVNRFFGPGSGQHVHAAT